MHDDGDKGYGDTTTAPFFGGPDATYLPGQDFMYTMTVTTTVASPIAVREVF